jgi:hypothetical protein
MFLIQDVVVGLRVGPVNAFGNGAQRALFRNLIRCHSGSVEFWDEKIWEYKSK